MNKIISLKGLLIVFLISVCVSSCKAQHLEDTRILVFSKTAEWHHESIPAGNKALIKLGEENKILVDTTTASSFFNEDNLRKYAAVVFLNTTGDVLNDEQEEAFMQYIQSGGGFVGIHGASDTEHDWEWYGELVGGYFKNHPDIQEAVLHVVDKKHPSTEMLPNNWVRTDEWYNFRNLNKEVNLLITIDEESYNGGENNKLHPMAWYHSFDGGRAFYTALGHSEEAFSEPLFLEHLLGGINYAIGE
ncbi:ThuA domain-containing protein [Zunongwangia pacifica]|uniref:ThuA domain-containing protein n=1 Tax=Zunongwangia pacifica TaxID=2911062 RepID=UPI0020BFDE1E|nr:ThuA domain-containing protein [Zunongwangia pacifica]